MIRCVMNRKPARATDRVERRMKIPSIIAAEEAKVLTITRESRITMTLVLEVLMAAPSTKRIGVSRISKIFKAACTPQDGHVQTFQWHRASIRTVRYSEWEISRIPRLVQLTFRTRLTALTSRYGSLIQRRRLELFLSWALLLMANWPTLKKFGTSIESLIGAPWNLTWISIIKRLLGSWRRTLWGWSWLEWKVELSGDLLCR